MFLPTTLKGRYIERMTDEEFLHFCQDNRGFKFERTSEGQIILMSPTGFITGDRNSSIIKQIRNWNDRYKLGRAVDSDTGFYLPNKAMRNPDAAWVSHERLRNISSTDLEGFPHLCPDFVVELRSKGGDTLKELKAKMEEWMANGCRLGWLIDADEEVVYVYQNGAETIHKGFDNPLSGEPVLPGFTMILAELRV